MFLYVIIVISRKKVLIRRRNQSFKYGYLEQYITLVDFQDEKL